MKIKWVFVLIFFVLISIPLLLTPTNNFLAEDQNSENRLKAKLPTFSKTDPFNIILDTETYIKDNFGFRSSLSNLYFLLKNELYKTDPLPEKVRKGKEGWYFLGNSEQQVFDESIGLLDHNDDEIEAIGNKIMEMHDYCDSLGIKFYFAVAPNKHTFYKEYLPLTPNKKPRRFELVKNWLKHQRNFDIIDLTESLLPLKDSMRLYYKTDSHWNSYGSFFATQQLLAVIRDDFPVRELEIGQFNIDTVINYRMDLTKMLKLKVPEEVYQFNYIDAKEPLKIDTIPMENLRSDSFLKIHSNEVPVKSFVFRDSFFTAMFPFFSNSVGESTYYWSAFFSKEMILRERPDFVVFEVIERKLGDITVQKSRKFIL